MNISYVSGFFDADGYVTLVKLHRSDIAYSPIIGFTNTQLSLLEQIQRFLFSNFTIKGHISKKKARKDNHNESYDLKYVQNAAITLGKILESVHPKKSARIQLIITDYKMVVKRNGKYTTENLKELKEFHSKFYA